MIRWLTLFSVLVICCLASGVPAQDVANEPEAAAPKVFASPINGGCYLAAPDECRIHADPVTINVAAGEHLTLMQLRVNNQIIYDFRTDASNPPPGDYSPVLDGLDFAVACGTTYYLSLVIQDSGDPSPVNGGSTTTFTCPSGVPPT
jgi:hypothetical protein